MSCSRLLGARQPLPCSFQFKGLSLFQFFEFPIMEDHWTCSESVSTPGCPPHIPFCQSQPNSWVLHGLALHPNMHGVLVALHAQGAHWA